MNDEERETQENITRIAPVIRQAVALRKAGRFDEAFATLRPYFERNEVPSYFSQPAGWAVYSYIKANMSRLYPQEATTVFGYYLNISPHEPDMVNSYVMILAANYKKLHTMEFDFIAFCRSWNLTTFRDEDYLSAQGKTSDGKPITYQSTAVKVATLLYKDLKRQHTPEIIEEFMPFFVALLTRCPDYEFTPLYIANMHAWCGKCDEAISQFREMLVSNQQWYLWKHLGDLLDNQLKVSCYCKALSMTDKEEYIGEIHLALAKLLEKSNPQQAAYEVGKYLSTCREHNWRIKSDGYIMESRLRNITPEADGKAFYVENVAEAEQYAYDEQPQSEFVFSGSIVNRKGKKRACLDNRAEHVHLKVPFTPELQKASAGDVFICRYTTNNNRYVLLTAHPTGRRVRVQPHGNHSAGNHEQQHQNNMRGNETRELEGVVRRRDGQPFAFVNDCFIPPHICSSAALTNGQHIRVLAFKQDDGRWRARRLLS